jgi:hypothetical protein
MVEAFVTSAGLMLGNAELLWIRSHDQFDSVYLIQGTSFESLHQYPEQWLYFATSECLKWKPDLLGCRVSRLQVGLAADVRYDLVAWSEAENRQVPEREMVPITQGWSFNPADIDMNGAVGCADLDAFAAGPYDWNLDGEVTAADFDQLVAALAAARADLNGDGVVDSSDLEILLFDLGCRAGPDSWCVGDLDCDGITGIRDWLMLVALLGS